MKTVARQPEEKLPIKEVERTDGRRAYMWWISFQHTSMTMKPEIMMKYNHYIWLGFFYFYFYVLMNCLSHTWLIDWCRWMTSCDHWYTINKTWKRDDHTIYTTNWFHSQTGDLLFISRNVFCLKCWIGERVDSLQRDLHKNTENRLWIRHHKMTIKK